MTPGQLMRAVCSDKLGSFEAYHIVEQALPEPAAAEVLVRIHAVSLGYADALLARGGYQVTPPLPFVPGTEASGVVAAVGSDVPDWQVGEAVVVTRFGGCLADHVVAAAAEVHKMPSGMSFAEACCYRSNYATALHALSDRAMLQRGETLLVLGAAGGVGAAAVQVGKRLGARVIAGASTAERRAFAASLGADDVLDYAMADWRRELREFSRGGVDVVLDPVGGALTEPAFRSLAWGGRHLVVGFAAGAIPRLPINLALLKGAALIGVDIRQFGIRQPERALANDALIAGWCAADLRPPVGSRFAFADFRAALAAAFSGTSLGKVIIEVTASEVGMSG